jgi:hypothetical protein
MARRHILTLGWMIAAVCLGGCANSIDGDSVRAAFSEPTRDSVLAGSALPGSGVVGRALHETDRAADRAATLDSLGR